MNLKTMKKVMNIMSSPQYSIKVGSEWIITDYVTFCRDNYLEKGHTDKRALFDAKQALEITRNIPQAVLVPEPKKTLAIYYRGWVVGPNKKNIHQTLVILGLVIKETNHAIIIQETTNNTRATILKSNILKMVTVS